MFDTESIDKPVVGFAIPIHIVAGDDASEAGDDSAQCDLMFSFDLLTKHTTRVQNTPIPMIWLSHRWEISISRAIILHSTDKLVEQLAIGFGPPSPTAVGNDISRAYRPRLV
mgnify:CR=1 FL=1